MEFYNVNEFFKQMKNNRNEVICDFNNGFKIINDINDFNTYHFKNFNKEIDFSKRMELYNYNKKWLDNGFYIEKELELYRYGDTFNSEITSIYFSSIQAPKNSFLIYRNEKIGIKTEIKEKVYHIEDNIKDKNKLTDYIETYKHTLSKQNVIDYINSYSYNFLPDEGINISFYRGLNDDLKKDNDIINSLINCTFTRNYYFFPDVFEDNILKKFNEIGLTDNISHDEIIDKNKSALKEIIEYRGSSLIKDKLKDYEKDVSLYNSKDKISSLLKEYKDILYVIDIIDNKNYVNIDDINWKDNISLELSFNKETLEEFENTNDTYTWVEKYITKRKLYIQNKKRIFSIKQDIKQLEESLLNPDLNIDANSNQLYKDIKTYNNLPKEIKEQCNYYFKNKLNKLPRDSEGLEDYFTKLNNHINDYKSEYDLIKSILNPKEQNHLQLENETIEELEL